MAPVILLTNDDGVDSPALLPFARALSALAPVRVVVPDRERSWIGKAISRWDELTTQQVEREGLELVCVSGSPADCVNLASHKLLPAPPDLVISGVNLGLNTGAGFFLSSGTVGAAMEGWIAGIPSLAFSVGSVSREQARQSQASGDDFWQRAAGLSADIAASIHGLGYPRQADLISVNFPPQADLSTPRVITRLARVGYRGLFVESEAGRFRHDYRGEIHSDAPPADDSDVAVVSSGCVSITPVRLTADVSLDPTQREALERS